MTGREALREAARLETAAVYGRTVPEASPASRGMHRADDVRLVAAANLRAVHNRPSSVDEVARIVGDTLEGRRRLNALHAALAGPSVHSETLSA